MVNIQLFLREHKLAATAGLYGTVGAANWSMGGGYGPYNGRFGMGVEQIVAARVVNAQGEVADADEEMLWGIRGAGGNFGVAVELELKVHKLEKMLWGQVFFALAEAKRVFEGYRDLIATEWPEEWYGGFVFLNIPGVGKVLMLYGSWCSDDLKRGWAYVEKVRALGTPVIDTVKEGKCNSQFSMQSTKMLMLTDRKSRPPKRSKTGTSLWSPTIVSHVQHLSHICLTNLSTL